MDGDAELTGMRFAVVDIETTGLRASRHHILQIAVVTVDVEGTVLDEWSTYVRPGRWPFARLGPRRVHGINRRTVRRAPPARDALAELVRRVDGAVLTAHNLRFDAEFLQRGARRAGVAFPESTQLCTLLLSRSLDPEAALSHRLVDVCRRYGVALDRPHDALEDARATAAVLPHLLRSAGVTRVAQLAIPGGRR